MSGWRPALLRGPSLIVLAAVVAVATAEVAPPDPEDGVRVAELRAATESLCDVDSQPRWYELTAAAFDSISQIFSRHNWRVVERADSLLAAGWFGDPTSGEARAGARLYLQIRSWNAMETSLNMASGPGFVWIDRPDRYLDLLGRYTNIAMYPLRGVVRARVGDGAFCLRYEIPSHHDQVMVFGETKIRIRTDRLQVGNGVGIPVWSREWLAGDGKKLELLFAENFTGRIDREVVIDDGDEIEISTFSDLRGVWVRRHGVHQLKAMVSWRNHLVGDALPERPRVGATAYFPRIKIDLPVFLPDLGVDDLREFPYPPPVFESRLFEDPERSFPDWIRARSNGEFQDWDSKGPRPWVVDERFPDL